jgi:hypothetical protein
VDERLAHAVALVGVGGQDLEQLAGVVAAHRQHRVDREVDDQPVPVQLHRHRVDQERHVVGDDLDDRVDRPPAVLLEARTVDMDLGGARLAPLGGAQVGHDGAVQVVRLAFHQVLRRHPPVVLAGERLHLRATLLRHPFVDQRDDLLEDLRGLLWLRRHDRLPSLTAVLLHHGRSARQAVAIAWPTDLLEDAA